MSFNLMPGAMTMPNIEAVLAGSERLAGILIPLLTGVASVLAGMVCIFLAIRSIFNKASDGRQSQQGAGWGGIGMQLLIGGLLLAFSSSVEEVSRLVTGSGVQDYHQVLAYAPIAAQSEMWKKVFEVCLLWVTVLGWAGAFRGLLHWHQAASGGGQGQAGDLFFRGFWFLLGGALSVNIAGALQSFFGH